MKHKERKGWANRPEEIVMEVAKGAACKGTIDGIPVEFKRWTMSESQSSTPEEPLIVQPAPKPSPFGRLLKSLTDAKQRQRKRGSVRGY